MKHLSRDERIGAIVLAIVCLVIVSGAWLYRSFRDRPKQTPPEVHVIYQQKEDSSSNKRSFSSDSTHKKQRKKANKKAGDRKSGKAKKKAKSSDSLNPRDHLRDTIATIR